MIKAYEKWYKENLYDRTETKKAWKAALKWALNQETWIGIEKAIEEELEDE